MNNKYKLPQNAFSREHDKRSKTIEEIKEVLIGSKHKEIIDIDEPCPHNGGDDIIEEWLKVESEK